MRQELEKVVHTILRTISEEEFWKTIMERWSERMRKTRVA